MRAKDPPHDDADTSFQQPCEETGADTPTLAGQQAVRDQKGSATSLPLFAYGLELELAKGDDEDTDVKKPRRKRYSIWSGAALAFLACSLASCGQAKLTPTAESGSGALLRAAMTRVATPAAAATEAIAPTAVVAPALGAVGETVGRVQLPSLGIDAPIVEVSWHLAQVEGQTLAEWDEAQNAAGHHRGTGGLDGAGNCVLAGHSNPEEGVFQGLWDAQSGAEVLLTDNAGRQYRYVVSEVFKLQETGADLAQRHANAVWLAPTADTRLTLITCWPEWAYTHRVIVIARPG